MSSLETFVQRNCVGAISMAFPVLDRDSLLSAVTAYTSGAILAWDPVVLTQLEGIAFRPADGFGDQI
jgi:hypothetical protein